MDLIEELLIPDESEALTEYNHGSLPRKLTDEEKPKDLLTSLMKGIELDFISL